MAGMSIGKPQVKVTVEHVGKEGGPDEEAAETPEFEKYELDHAVETLQKAAEIRQNPKLMKAIKPHLDRKIKAVKSMADLRQRAKKVVAAEPKEEPGVLR